MLLLVRNGNAYKTQDCADTSALDQEHRDMMDVLYSVEHTFDCSKWCNDSGSNLFFKFSDVNRGRPQSYCYDEMKEK